MTPSPAKVDAEFAAYADKLGADSKREAQRHLQKIGEGLDISYRQVASRGAGDGLIEAVGEDRRRRAGRRFVVGRCAWPGGTRVDHRLAAALVEYRRDKAPGATGRLEAASSSGSRARTRALRNRCASWNGSRH